jgi:hypothetical protein
MFNYLINRLLWLLICVPQVISFIRSIIIYRNIILLLHYVKEPRTSMETFESLRFANPFSKQSKYLLQH